MNYEFTFTKGNDLDPERGLWVTCFDGDGMEVEVTIKGLDLTMLRAIVAAAELGEKEACSAKETGLYRVSWEIDVHADSPREAAQRAQEVQRDRRSEATVFKVNGVDIDLDDQVARVARFATDRDAKAWIKECLGEGWEDHNIDLIFYWAFAWRIDHDDQGNELLNTGGLQMILPEDEWNELVIKSAK